MKSDFYVIVIDDKKEVCQRIEGKIAGGSSPGSVDPIVPVRVQSIHVSLSETCRTGNPIDSRWAISEDICDSLINAASSKPDLIILDYAYVDSKVSAILREKAQRGEFTEESMVDRVLTPLDLRQWIESTEKLSENLRHKVNYHRPCRWLCKKTTTPDNVIRCRPSTG